MDLVLSLSWRQRNHCLFFGLPVDQATTKENTTPKNRSSTVRIEAAVTVTIISLQGQVRRMWEENPKIRVAFEVPQQMHGSLYVRHTRLLHKQVKILHNKSKIGTDVCKEIKSINQTFVYLGSWKRFPILSFRFHIQFKRVSNRGTIRRMKLSQEIMKELSLMQKNSQSSMQNLNTKKVVKGPKIFLF